MKHDLKICENGKDKYMDKWHKYYITITMANKILYFSDGSEKTKILKTDSQKHANDYMLQTYEYCNLVIHLWCRWEKMFNLYMQLNMSA